MARRRSGKIERSVSQYAEEGSCGTAKVSLLDLGVAVGSAEFHRLIDQMAQAIARGDAAAATACFTPDGTYHDGFYGEFAGRAAIADMVTNHFHVNAKDLVWAVKDAIADGALGYASYDFAYTSKMPGSEARRVTFSGISRCRLRDGLIERYDEIFERALALVQLDFAEARIVKSLRRWAEAKQR
jgi:uncharacterized protein (TIGR02246 family)